MDNPQPIDTAPLDGTVILTDALREAVSVCVDDYGNQIFATTAGYAAPHKSNYRHI